MVAQRVVIVGGGVLGLFTAYLLGSLGLHVVVLEHGKLSEMREAFDLRVVALTEYSRRVLAVSGLWDSIIARRCAPYTAMNLWDTTGSGAVSLNASDTLMPTLGHIVEQQVLASVLQEALARISTVELLPETGFASFRQTQQAICVEDTQGRVWEADLLVGADGANSRVRAQAGLPTKAKQFGQTALVATLNMERPHQDTAFQVFSPSGTLALLPLPEAKTVSMVWSLPTTEALAESQALQEAITQKSDGCLGACQKLSATGRFPLQHLQVTHYHHRNLVCLGDAAHVIHPLAGQGLNLGIADVVSLADQIQQALTRGQRIGEEAVLSRFTRARRFPNAAMGSLMEVIKWGVEQQNPLLHTMRQVGMRCFDQQAWLKERVINAIQSREAELPVWLARMDAHAKENATT